MWSRLATDVNPLQPVAAPDDVEHDLVGAGADPVQTNVAVGALDLVLLHVAVAAEDLDALVGALAADPGGEQLHFGDLAHRVLAVGVAPGDHVVELLRGFDLGCHLGELVANRLELPDRPPERLALPGVFQRLLEHTLSAGDGARRGDHALALKLPADVVEALADL